MKTAIVLGTFDGLHAGHCAVIDAVKDFFSVAVTFDVPPKSFFTGEPQLLMLPEDRAARLNSLGINEVKLQKFSDIKDIAPLRYLEILKETYNPDRIVCGFNYRFGKGALGDTKLLGEFCDKNGIEFICIPPIEKEGQLLSSTHIRGLVRDGRISDAAKLMYGGFSFEATVVHGDARGRQLGFPTANQEYPNDLVKVKFGVYISRVTICDKQYSAITNIGVRPTYKTNYIGCESFIKDFSDDIYGKKMKTELLQYVREEKKFSSVEELKTAVLNDIKLLD